MRLWGQAALVIAQAQARAAAAPTVQLLSACATLAQRPDGSGAWGLARSVRAEAAVPLLCADGAAALALALMASVREPEVVVRGEARLVPRL